MACLIERILLDWASCSHRCSGSSVGQSHGIFLLLTVALAPSLPWEIRSGGMVLLHPNKFTYMRLLSNFNLE